MSQIRLKNALAAVTWLSVGMAIVANDFRAATTPRGSTEIVRVTFNYYGLFLIVPFVITVILLLFGWWRTAVFVAAPIVAFVAFWRAI
jgi:hypothetical protein